MATAKAIVESTRKSFNSGITKSIPWRLNQLQKMLDMIENHTDEFKAAVAKDLRKPGFEVDLMELLVLKNEIYATQKSLNSWAKSEYPSKTIAQTFDTIELRHEPYGVALVMGAWNYPVNLLLCPVVGAIAAGNCCVIKPSEISEATATLIAKLVPKYLDTDCFKVYCGGVPETTLLLQEKFDYIFFTGSTNVGKIVMKAASTHLTPVTLELGGKSPCYIDEGSDLNLVAKRVIWGKLTNCGQTCVAPDYILCHKSVATEFAKELKGAITKFYGENPRKSPDMSRIVNERNFSRLVAIMEKMPKEKLAFGGETDITEKYIEPTCYVNVSMEDSVMEEELFGPILSIMNVESADEAISIVNQGEKPLALYVFSNSNKVIDEFLNKTSSGGVLVNDTLMQCGAANVPFGGVGASGIGSYHGKSSFETFSHKKPIWKRKQNMEAMIAARYPPFSDGNLRQLQMLTTERSFCNIL